MSKVLVTGGTGFLGGHAILQLVAKGHDVRATVRNADRAIQLRRALKLHGVDADQIEIVHAELMDDHGWDEATNKVDFVLHVASPFPAQVPDDANELIVPARDGALRVLRAARLAKVKRVVMTSSFAAVGYGTPARDRPFDEEDWTDPKDGTVQPYMQSKYYAERAAWDFVEQEGDGLELSVINPTGIFGPRFGDACSTSVGLIKGLLEGALPAVPRISFGAVDVRDVVDLHLRAMAAPQARGQRFIAVSGKALWLKDVADILRAELGEQAAKVPAEEMADEEVRRLAQNAPAMAAMVPQLGILRETTASKAQNMLGWQPRPAREAILASVLSLLDAEEREAL